MAHDHTHTHTHTYTHAHTHTHTHTQLYESFPVYVVNEFCPLSTAKKKKALNTISLLASSTLAKASFLCSVLSEDTECHYLAFKIGMFGMELARPPASCKALEVTL